MNTHLQVYRYDKKCTCNQWTAQGQITKKEKRKKHFPETQECMFFHLDWTDKVL